MAQHQMSDNAALFDLIDKIVSLATDLGESDQDYVEAMLMAQLDSLVVAIYQVTPQSDPSPDLLVEEADTKALRSVLSQRFPRWGTYNTVMSITDDMGDTDLALGNAIDDLIDIISELLVVRAARRDPNESQAEWMLIDGYYNFWRGPLRSLQLFLHYLEIETQD